MQEWAGEIVLSDAELATVALPHTPLLLWIIKEKSLAGQNEMCGEIVWDGRRKTCWEERWRDETRYKWIDRMNDMYYVLSGELSLRHSALCCDSCIVISQPFWLVWWDVSVQCLSDTDCASSFGNASLRGIVLHKNSVIIYSPSCSSKPTCIPFPCATQKKLFWKTKLQRWTKLTF